MLEPNTRWVMRRVDEGAVRKLAEQLQIAPLVARILAGRGITDAENARSFLFSDGIFYDPFLLPDMEKSVERIRRAVRDGEKIMIYGDYDADGVTSTYCLLKTLKTLGADVQYYIPDRLSEGYGPNEKAFRRFKEEGIRLIITVDNGISALHEAKVAKESGMDLIITDHHELKDELPDAYGIIHPKRKDSKYPFKDLAGVGVSFKLSSALLGKPPSELLPYAAIGTIADLVPLIGENRWIVKKGIPLLKETKDIGLSALIKNASLDMHQIDENGIAFALAPRLNAPGRLGSANLAVELFLTKDPGTAGELAGELSRINQERQDLVNRITGEAVEQAERLFRERDDKVLVVGDPDWHPGVIGIVASKLVEKFYKPAVVLSYDEENGTAKGSARSIHGFNIYENLAECADLLLHFGGHPMAAGMVLRLEDVDELRSRLNRLADQRLTEEDFIPLTEYDCRASLQEITLDAVEQLEKLAPFGTGNPKPKILVEDVRLSNCRKVGADENHLKTVLQKDPAFLEGIGFDMGPFADHISPLARASVIGELGINEWNSTRKPQIYIKDIAVNEWQLFDCRGNKNLPLWLAKVPEENRKIIVFRETTLAYIRERLDPGAVTNVFSDAEAESAVLDGQNVVLLDLPPTKNRLVKLVQGKRVSRIYAHFYQERDHFFDTVPEREHFKWYYAFLLKNESFDIGRHGRDLAKYRGWTERTVHFMTRVFLELGFIEMEKGIVSVNRSAKKRDLSESAAYRELREHVELEKELLFSTAEQLKNWFDRLLKSKIGEEKIWI
jgi:single-stranded-DNA-specific exonuclease